MTDPLASESLMAHVRVLAEDIGPRQTGTIAEARARDYIRQKLIAAGIDSIEELPFAPATSFEGVYTPVLVLMALGNLLGLAGRVGKLVGGMTALTSAYTLAQIYKGLPSLLAPFESKGASANLIVRLP